MLAILTNKERVCGSLSDLEDMQSDSFSSYFAGRMKAGEPMHGTFSVANSVDLIASIGQKKKKAIPYS